MLENLEPRLLFAANLSLIDPGLRGDGATNLFPVIQELLSGNAANTTGALEADLPLIGDQLATHTSGQIAGAIEDAWSSGGNQSFNFSGATVAQVEQEIADRFASLGATVGNVETSGAISSNLVTFKIPLTQTLTNQTFDLIVREAPAVEILLGHTAQVTADVTWSFDLVIGVTDTSFFIDVSNSSTITNGHDEISVNIAGTVKSGLAGYGKLGIFGAFYTQSPTASHFDYTYSIDLKTPNTNKRLTSAQWPTAMQVETEITGSAVANFHAQYGAIPDFGGLVTTPSNSEFDLDFTTDVVINWPTFKITDPAKALVDYDLTYKNTQMNSITFVNGIMNSNVGELKDVFQSLGVLVDVLTDPIPGIDDLFKKAGLGRAPNMIELLELLYINDQNALTSLLLLSTFLDVVDGILGFKNYAASDMTQSSQSTSTDNMDNIGAVTFGFRNGTHAAREGATGKKFQLLDKQPDPDLQQLMRDRLAESSSNEKLSKRMFVGGAGFEFPFVNDPGILFDMMVGDPSGKFFDFTTSLELDLITEWVIGFPFKSIANLLKKVGITAEAGFAINFNMVTNFTYAYDGVGIKTFTDALDFSNLTNLALSVTGNEDLLLQGKVFDDHNNTGNFDGVQGAVAQFSTGLKPQARDEFEFGFELGFKPFVRLGLDADVLDVEVKLSGGLEGSLRWDINDLPNGAIDYLTAPPASNPTKPTQPYSYDGQLRGLERRVILDNAGQYLNDFEYALTFGGFFNFGGSLDFELDLNIEATLFRFLSASYELNLAKFTIVSGNIASLSDQQLLDGIAFSKPIIGEVESSGNLNLFVGPDANRRAFTATRTDPTSDGGVRESFTISSRGATNPNRPQDGETLIVSFTGYDATGKQVGSGQRTFNNVKSITAEGGSDIDTFDIAASVGVPATIQGGAGNDKIAYEGTANVNFSGDDGDDIVRGGLGNDTLAGGIGADTISGGDGDDHLFGGNDNDQLDGGNGNDTLEGGAGDDDYRWSAQSGMDHISDSSGAMDVLKVTGASIAVGQVGVVGSQSFVDQVDDIVLTAAGSTLSLVNMNFDSLDVVGVEDVNLTLGGGDDTVTYGDLSSSGVQSLAIDLSGGSVIVQGSSMADTVAVRGVAVNNTPGVVEVDTTIGGGSLFTTHLINTSRTNDLLQVTTLAGADTITIEAGQKTATDLISVDLDGGADNDIIAVNAGDVRNIKGGAGDDDISVVAGNHHIIDTGSTDIVVRDDGNGTLAPTFTLTRQQDGSGNVLSERDGVTKLIKIDAGNDNLTVDVSAAPTGGNVVIRDTFTTNTSVLGGSASDAITVEATTNRVVIQPAGGDDTVTFGDGDLSRLGGTVSAQGGAGADTVIYNDRNDQTARPTIQVNATNVTGIGALANPSIDAAFETVRLNLGQAANVVTIPLLSRHVFVDGGSDATGIDSVIATMVGASAGASDPRRLSTIKVEDVQFTFDDQGTTNKAYWLLGGSQLLASPSSSRASLQHVVLDVTGATQATLNLGDGPGGDNLIVRSLTEPRRVNLRGGDDEVALGDGGAASPATIDGVLAPLTIDAGAGTNMLNVDERARADDATVTLSNGSVNVASSASATIHNIGFAGASVTGSTVASAHPTIVIRDLAVPTVVDATGAAVDTVRAEGGFADLTVLGDSIDDLIIDESASAAVTATLADDVVAPLHELHYSRTGSSIDIDGFARLTVQLSGGADTLTIDTSVATPLIVNGNAGNDTVVINEIGARTEIEGGAGNDTVRVVVAGLPSDAVHDILLNDLRVWTETLLVDQSGGSSTVDWRTQLGLLEASDAGSTGFEPFIRQTGAQQVRIRGGSAIDDTLAIDETFGTITAIGNANSFQVTDGLLNVLSGGMSENAATAGLVFNDILSEYGRLYAMGDDAVLRVIDASTLQVLSTFTDSSVTASSRVAGDVYFAGDIYVTGTNEVIFLEQSGVNLTVAQRVPLSFQPLHVSASTGVPEEFFAVGETDVAFVDLSEPTPIVYQISLTAGLPAGAKVKDVYRQEQGLYVAIDVPGADNDVLRVVDIYPVYFLDSAPVLRPASTRIGEGPVSMAAGSSTTNGQLLYVASEQDARVDVVEMRFISGLSLVPSSLQARATIRPDDAGMRGLEQVNTITTSGSYLFAASQALDTVSVYQRSGDGLTFLQTLYDTSKTAFGDARLLQPVGNTLLVAGEASLTALDIASAPTNATHGVGFENIESVTFTTGDGDDVISASAAPATNTFVLNTAGGNDTVTIAGAAPDHTINTGGAGSDNDKVTVTGNIPGLLTINVGDQTNTVSVSGSVGLATDLRILGGTGVDTVTVSGLTGSGGSFDIDTGSAADMVIADAPAGSTFAIKTGASNDHVIFGSAGAGAVVTIDTDGGVAPGDQDDTITLNFAGIAPTAAVTIEALGQNNDTLLPLGLSGVTLFPNDPDNPSTPGVNEHDLPKTVNGPAGPDNVDVVGIGMVTYYHIESIPGFAPTRVFANGPYSVLQEGFGVNLQGVVFPADDTPAPTIVAVGWDLDADGLFDDVTQASKFVTWRNLVDLTRDGAVPIDDNGVYTIAIQAIDSEGFVATATTTLTVPEGDPSLFLPLGEVVPQPEVTALKTYEVGYFDSGNDPVRSFTIAWGDGTSDTYDDPPQPDNIASLFFTFTVQHQYDTFGTMATPDGFQVTITFETDEGTFVTTPGPETFLLMRPTTPKVQGTEPIIVLEGQPLTFTANAPGSDAVLVDFTQDTAPAIGAEFTGTSGSPIAIPWSSLTARGITDNGTGHFFDLYSDYTSKGFTIGDVGSVDFVSDSNGPADPASNDVTGGNRVYFDVINAPPTATGITGDSVNQGESAVVTLLGLSDPSADDLAAGLSIGLDLGNDGTIDVIGTSTGGDQAVAVPANVLAQFSSPVAVRAVVMDKDGGELVLFTTINVADVTPVPMLSGDATVDEGALYTLSMSAPGLQVGPGTRWVVDWGDGTTLSVLASDAGDLTHTYADAPAAGVMRTITATAFDEDGSYEETTSVLVNNVAPTLLISSDTAIKNEGTEFLFTLMSSDPGDDTIQSWLIDFGDGSTPRLVSGDTLNVNHTYADNGAFVVTASATDEDGTYAAPDFHVNIINVTPKVTFGSASDFVDEGATFTLNIEQIEDPGSDHPTSVIVNWGDGTSSTVPLPTSAITTESEPNDDGAPGPGTSVDDLIASNDLRGSSSKIPAYSGPGELFVTSITGAVSAADDQDFFKIEVAPGDTVDVSLSGALASPVLGLWLRPDALDQTPLANLNSGAGVSTQPGVDDLTVTAADGTGFGVDLDSAVTVQDVLDAINDAAVSAGASVTAAIGSNGAGITIVDTSVGVGMLTVVDANGSTAATDLGIAQTDSDDDGVITGAPLVFPVQLASGTTSLHFDGFTQERRVYVSVESSGGATGGYTLDVDHIRTATVGIVPRDVTHVYADGEQTHTVSLTVVDEDGFHVVAQTLDVRVLNVTPAIDVGGPVMVNENETYTLNLASVVDPGDDTPTDLIVDWGDGAIESVGVVSQATHVYTTPGAYTIAVSIQDEDGISRPGAGAYQLSLQLTDADALPVITSDVEPNDDGVDGVLPADLAAANDLRGSFSPIGGNDFVANLFGEIDSAADFGDFYRIDALGGETITASLLGVAGGGGTLLDPTLSLFDAAGNLVASNDDISVMNPDAMLTYPVTSDGAYYLMADTELIPDPTDGSMMIRGVGTYALQTVIHRPTAAPFITAESEGNDDRFTADDLTGSLIVLGAGRRTATVTGMIDEGLDRDLDYFRIVAAPGDSLTIDLTGNTSVSGALREPALRLVDRDGNMLAMDATADGVGNAQITFSNFTYDGDYFIVADSLETFGVQDVVVKPVVAPTIAISGNPTAIESTAYTLTLGQITGPGAGQVNEIIVDWGDGNTEMFTTTGNVTHTYPDDFDYTIDVDLMTIDTTLFENAAQQRLTVEGVPPVVVLDPVLGIDEAGTATLTGSFSDIGLLDTFTLKVNWGDPTSPTNVQTFNYDSGAAPGQPFTLTHQYLDDSPAGMFTATVTVIDDDNAAGMATEMVQVANLDPVITLFTVPANGAAGAASMFSAAATDAGGAGDPLTFTWSITLTTGPNAGATSQLVGADVDFTPTEAGDYDVTLVVTDDDGGSANTSGAIHIAQSQITPAIVVEPTAGLITAEFGSVDTFTVALTTVPTAGVTVPVTVNDITEGEISLDGVTFSAMVNVLLSDTTPVTVYVRGVADGINDGDVLHTLTVGPAASGDTDYDALDADDVTVLNRDFTPDVTVDIGDLGAGKTIVVEYEATVNAGYDAADNEAVATADNLAPTVAVTTTPIDRPPRVSQVFVAGSSWNSAFLDGLAASGQGDATFGYAIPTGADQLTNLAYLDLDRVSIRFTEEVDIELTDLQLFSIDPITVDSFDYDMATNTATWRLQAPIGSNRIRLVIADGSVTDSEMNQSLDGEWDDGASSFNSGNGVAGGAFSFRFDVKPGDVTDNDITRVSDVIAVRDRQGTGAASTAPNTIGRSYDARYDINGDGDINIDDVLLTRNRVFDPALPTAEPGGAASPGWVPDPTPGIAPTSIAGGVTLTKTVAIAGDVDNDGKADAGDTLRYTVTLTVPNGVDAIGLQLLDDLGPDLTLTKSGPLALPDAYSTVEGAAIVETDANLGLRGNDYDIDGVTPTASLVVSNPVGVGSPLGSLAVNADGTFTYTPPTTGSGFVDTFTYDVTDADGLVGTGTVMFMVNAGTPLLAAEGAIASTNASLSADALGPIVNEAIARFASAGVSDRDAQSLRSLAIRITDLPGALLAAYADNTVYIDINGAGHGYFIDPTPDDDSEFAGDGPIDIDLLSVVMHEFGHALGMHHNDDARSVMAASLSTGARLRLVADENGNMV